MRIILFQDGQPGEIMAIPGERPLEELGELLGGEVELIPLSARRMLAVVENGREMGLPARYQVARVFSAPMTIYGDAAVVATKRSVAVLDDINRDDFRAAALVLDSLSIPAHRVGAD